MIHLLDLIYSVEGMNGLEDLYRELKENCSKSSPSGLDFDLSHMPYSLLNGFVCSLPNIDNIDKADEQVLLALLITDYFICVEEKFLHFSYPNPFSQGFQEVLLEPFFKDIKEDINKESIFNIGIYFKSLKEEASKRQLTEKELIVMSRIQKIQELWINKAPVEAFKLPESKDLSQP